MASGGALMRQLDARQRQRSLRVIDVDNDNEGTVSRSISAVGKAISRRIYATEDKETTTNTTFANDILQQDLSRQKSYMELLRLRTKAFLSYTLIGHIYDWCLLLLSIISCLLFIYATYLPPNGTKNIGLNSFELLSAAIFSFDFCLSLFIADHRWEYLRSFYSLVDLLTVIPTWTTLGTTRPSFNDIHSAYIGILYVLYLFKTTRILRPLRIRRKFNYITDEVKHCLADMILRILIMILFNTGIMQYLELQSQPLPFHTWMYFLWVTTSTVGYGDIYPVTTLGQIAVMWIICFAIVVIPQMTNELLLKIGRSSVYARARYTPRVNSRHVIICGDLSSTSITEVFAELFHEDHENDELYAVILSTSKMTTEMKQVINNRNYELRVVFLEGTALFDDDLKRASAESAIGILLFTNKFTLTPDQEDSKIILQHHSIYRYIENIRGQAYANNEVTFSMQLMRPENQRHFDDAFISSESPTEHIVCLNEMKMGIIAKSVMFPGTAALIMNLLASFADEDGDGVDDDEEERIKQESDPMTIAINKAKAKAQAESLYRSSSSDAGNAPMLPSEMFLDQSPHNQPSKTVLNSDKKVLKWLEEYKIGCGWEIYTTDISHTFEGMVFKEFSYTLYDTLGIVLIGLQIEDLGSGNVAAGFPNYTKTVLNPADYVFPNQNKYKLRGLVIAQNSSSANLANVDAEASFFRKTVNNIKDKGAKIANNFNTIGRQALAHGVSKMGQSFLGMLGVGGVNSPNNSAQRRAPSSDDQDPKSPGFGSSYLLERTGIELNAQGIVETARPSDTSIAFGAMNYAALEAKRKRHRKRMMERFHQIRNSHDSVQEKNYKLEQEFIACNYYLRKLPHIGTYVKRMYTQAEVTIHTSVLEEIKDLHGHIIITGNGLNNLYDLIKPLRQKELGKMKFIVILYPRDIPHAVWQRICIFDGIAIVKGSPLEEEDICRAGVYRAQQIVILAGAYDVHSKGHHGTIQQESIGAGFSLNPTAAVGMEALLDSDTVFTYKAVKKMNDSVHCVVEFVKDGNINYLNPVNSISLNNDYKSCPQFAAGELFASSMLDTVVCQSFYNPHIVNIINRMVSSKNPMEFTLTATQHTTDSNAIVPDLDQIAGSSLYQIDIPIRFLHGRYALLYKKLSEQGIIPLGLYRAVPPLIHSADTSGYINKHPYVYTNPAKDTEIRPGDKVFVLSTKPIHSRITQTEEEMEREELMEEEIHQLLHNPIKANREHALALTQQRWILLLKRCELYYTSSSSTGGTGAGGEMISISAAMMKQLTEILEQCKGRIENCEPDELHEMGNPSDTESDLDDDDDSDSDSEGEEEEEDVQVLKDDGQEDSILDTKGLSPISKRRTNDASVRRMFREANKRVRKELCSSTRRTKFVIDTFITPINEMITELGNKQYNIIRMLANKYATKADQEGYHKLCCWFATLRDMVDVMVSIANDAKKKTHDVDKLLSSDGVSTTSHSSYYPYSHSQPQQQHQQQLHHGGGTSSSASSLNTVTANTSMQSIYPTNIQPLATPASNIYQPPTSANMPIVHSMQLEDIDSIHPHHQEEEEKKEMSVQDIEDSTQQILGLHVTHKPTIPVLHPVHPIHPIVPMSPISSHFDMSQYHLKKPNLPRLTEVADVMQGVTMDEIDGVRDFDEAESAIVHPISPSKRKMSTSRSPKSSPMSPKHVPFMNTPPLAHLTYTIELPEKAIELINDMIDHIEIAVWDAAVGEVY